MTTLSVRGSIVGIKSRGIVGGWLPTQTRGSWQHTGSIEYCDKNRRLLSLVWWHFDRVGGVRIGIHVYIYHLPTTETKTAFAIAVHSLFVLARVGDQFWHV